MKHNIDREEFRSFDEIKTRYFPSTDESRLYKESDPYILGQEKAQESLDRLHFIVNNSKNKK